MKGSYTVEAAVMVSLFLCITAAAMRFGLQLYGEVCADREQERLTELWSVKDFYHYQIGKGEKSDE